MVVISPTAAVIESVCGCSLGGGWGAGGAGLVQIKHLASSLLQQQPSPRTLGPGLVRQQRERKVKLTSERHRSCMVVGGGDPSPLKRGEVDL